MKIHPLIAKLFHVDGQSDRQSKWSLFSILWCL